MDKLIDQSSRMVRAGFDSMRLGMQVAETMAAAQGVIASRLWMVMAGMSGRGPMPYAEMARLIPEKAIAFNEAGLGAARALTSVNLGKASQLGAASVHDGMAVLDLYERGLAAATAWWLPVHSATSANARRLNRKRRR